MPWSSKPATLPIGVVLPTKNCAGLLPEHLSAMRAWLPLVEQVVVVDSFSNDGTLELLHGELTHRNLQFLQHPPGLYASWNCGIRNISARYVYIATAGDTISREGLESLLHAAESLEADVVLSKPRFCQADGTEVSDLLWPIDEIIDALQITRPTRLTRMQALVAALCSGTSALTGSCASDLFRTSALQRFPFPTEYGTAGDGAWGIQNAAELVWAIVPGRFSRFVRHTSNASSAERARYLSAPRLDSLARHTVQNGLADGLFTAEEIARSGVQDLLDHFSEFLEAKNRFDQKRRKPVPWILSPQAWRARSYRNRSNVRFTELKTRAFEFALGNAGSPASTRQAG